MRKYAFTDCVDLVGSAVGKFEGMKKYVSTGALDYDRIDFSQVEDVDYESKPSRANLSVNAGDILFAKMQGTKKTLVLDLKTQEYVYSTGFCAVRAKENIINRRCLYHLITGKDFLAQKDKNCSGATQRAITNKGLEKIVVSIPKISEQKEIAKRLDLADGAALKCQQILRKLDELVRARFVEMFGDPIENPMGWDKSPLGKRCNIITGNTPPRADAENYGTFLEWIKSDNINTPDTYLTVAEEYLSQKGFEKCRYVESGSVLMTCIAGSIGCIGNVAVADRRVAFNQQINAIVPSNDETLYIFWLMQLSKPYIQSMINMALKGILSKGQLSALEFPFPPLPRQTEFANFVRDMDKSKLAAKKCLEKAEYLKDALMQEYFG